MAESQRERVFRSIATDLYDQRIMGNQYRPHYVERLICNALGKGWNVVSASWNGWDLEHPRTRVRIEPKQSAAEQPWTYSVRMQGRPTEGTFDIRKPKSYFVDDAKVRVPTKVRTADMFIFARHPVMGRDADHRDFEQWEFGVLPESRLPSNDRISLRTVVKLTSTSNVRGNRLPLTYHTLGSEVDRAIRSVRSLKARRCVNCDRRLTRSSDPRARGGANGVLHSLIGGSGQARDSAASFVWMISRQCRISARTA